MQDKLELGVRFACERRRHLRSKMPRGSIALFFSARPKFRNGGICYPFRQNSDFFYLTYFNEDGAALILAPGFELLFLSPSDPKRELWDGSRLGLDASREQLAFNSSQSVVYTLSELPQQLLMLLKNKQLYYKFGQEAEQDQLVRQVLNELSQEQACTEEDVRPTQELINEMRLLKDTYEVSQIRQAARITQEGFDSILREARPGLYEQDIEALLSFHFIRNGAQHAYPPIVASGSNACTLHYTKNNALISDQSIILVDAGAEYGCFASDVTRSFPASTCFTAMQREIYTIVLNAQKAALAACNLEEASLSTVHEAALLTIVEALMELGLLIDPEANTAHAYLEKVRACTLSDFSERRESLPHMHFFMHRTSHWLGLDVHDVIPHDSDGHSRYLEKGMCFTIEPGLYFTRHALESMAQLHAKSAKSFPEKHYDELIGIGIRIEDDIYMAPNKNDKNGENGLSLEAHNLTESIPKELDDIEALRRDTKSRLLS